ncbi:MAG TPA: hypothetical protein VGR30_03260 [Candidatus Binatia bacterium]|nr:hypothetical protein [Candidatus Binatia bacterium]
MKKTIFVFSISFFILIAVGTPNSSLAQTSSVETEAARMDTLAASQGQSKVSAKISSDFSSFLKNVDSQAVVTGLRSGQLTSTTPSSTGTGTPTTTTVALPTGKMGHGNVYISLALAKQQLGQYGVTQPTQEQLQAALLGGSITTVNGTTTTNHQLQGVLTMRSQGMGWGQIAHELGYKLGPIMSGMKNANHSIAAGTTTTSTTGKGVVNASGKPSGTSEGSIVTGSGNSVEGHGKGESGKGTSGEGIVTGSGRSAGGSASGVVTGRGNAYGVTGGGPGSGGEHGKGHNK